MRSDEGEEDGWMGEEQEGTIYGEKGLCVEDREAVEERDGGPV
jgi:hypothetical protein